MLLSWYAFPEALLKSAKILRRVLEYNPDKNYEKIFIEGFCFFFTLEQINNSLIIISVNCLQPNFFCLAVEYAGFMKQTSLLYFMTSQILWGMDFTNEKKTIFFIKLVPTFLKCSWHISLKFHKGDLDWQAPDEGCGSNNKDEDNNLCVNNALRFFDLEISFAIDGMIKLYKLYTCALTAMVIIAISFDILFVI